MRDDTLPRHRNGPGKAITGTSDTDAVVSKANAVVENRNGSKWKRLENYAGSRMGHKKIRYIVGFFAVLAFAALLRSDYALESTMDSGGNREALTITTTIPKEQTGQANTTNHSSTPPVMNLSAAENISASTTLPKQQANTTKQLATSTTPPVMNLTRPKSSLLSETSSQTTEKYPWDRGNEKKYFHKNPKFPYSIRLYRTLPDSERVNGTSRDRYQNTVHAFERRDQEFQRMNSTLELLPCRLDEIGSCLREKTAGNVESSTTSGEGAAGSAILLYNPLDEGKAFEMVVASVALLLVVT